MSSLRRTHIAILITAALLGACGAPPGASPPPPTPTPSPTPTPVVMPPETYVTLFEYPVARGCGVVAIPYHAHVREGGTIVWDVVDDACKSSPDLTLEFTDPSTVDVDQNPTRKQKKARVLAQDRKAHKYTVHLGDFVHDPEYEVWP
jgi:hypothetical protein